MTDFDAGSEEAVFSAALRCAPAERESFLERACAGQPGMRQRIRMLLDAQPLIGEFMEIPPGKDSSDATGVGLSGEPDGEGAGSQVGRYKLLQQIGEGGCGVVYMAEQETPIRRRVALKVIKLGMDTKQVLARFEAERQALALMDHPNIAKVFDAGTTQNGRPYFVMELVRGIRITEFCDQHRLTTQERLDLFIQVCEAVQHAHNKGIIHRDLKPSNILVTIHDPGAPGVPKIIDFGIAKATEGRLTEQTLFTAFEQFLGTPAYMSPEQAMMTSLDVDTRSDLYSLGVLLYELLAGRPPFDPKELLAEGFAQMRRTICELEPVRPSTRVSTLLAAEQNSVASFRQTEPLKLVHRMRGDLDWIVMKCLEKNRARRYETANALAMDLQRHLRNEPVTARPPSRWYVFQRTVRRHQAGFAAAVTILLVLAAAALYSGREARRARRAEQEARQTAYIADMDLANRAVQEGDLGIARMLLRRHASPAGNTGEPGWEWRYLAKLSGGDPHTTVAGLSSRVTVLRFLDSNTLLAAGQADWRTIVWDLRERRALLTITNVGFGGGISEVAAVSAKRQTMYFRAGWAYASSMSALDLESGREFRPKTANRSRADPDSPIRSLDLSPDEGRLAVAFGKQVALWDLNGETWSEPFPTKSGLASQGLFSPDGRLLVVGDDDGHLSFWNTADHRLLGVVTHGVRLPGVMEFSKDGRWLAVPGGDQPTQVWSPSDRQLVGTLPDSVVSELASFSPDGRWLAIVGGDACIRLWETERWRKIRTLRGHTDPIVSLNFSPDGRFLATGARNGEVKLWPMEALHDTGDRVTLPPAEYFTPAADGSGFGRVLLQKNADGAENWTCEVWSGWPLQRLQTLPLPGLPRSGAVLGGGRGLVLGGFDGSIRLLGPIVGNATVVSNAHPGEVYMFDVSLDGSTLATKGLSKTGEPEDRVRIWRLPGLVQIAELSHAMNVHSLKLSDDGTLLAGFTGPGDMGVWTIPRMEGPPMWRGVDALERIEVGAFSPDNRWLAAATPGGGAFLWDLTTHRRTVLSRAMTAYRWLSFSPDGRRLAAGSDGDGKLFDVGSGRELLTFKQPGLKLVFARDGERLLAVHRSGAFGLHAPPLRTLQFDWLTERLSDLPPIYRGPDPNYERPDRPINSSQP